MRHFNKLLLLLLCSSVTAAENVTLESSLRLRNEFVDWYAPAGSNADSSYSFQHLRAQLGARYRTERLNAFVQGQYFQLFDLPSSGSGPGATYATANDGEHAPGDLTLRQAYLSYGAMAPEQNYEIKAGRFLYSNGEEFINDNPDIEKAKKSRIYNRTIGTFEFTGGRSFDGLRATFRELELGGVSGGYLHPTQGGFATDGSIDITDIQIATLALTPPQSVLPHDTDTQLFFYHFSDSRNDTVLLDNRPLGARQIDDSDLQIYNLGAHWVEEFQAEDFTIQILLWGLIQRGDWGALDHRAAAYAAESAIRFKEFWAKPQLRAGINWGSGDSDPSDTRHETYFEMLPTARQYAFTPFFNQMNNLDLFLQLQVTPSDKWNVATAVHALSLDQGSDVLYAGGGANREHAQFGYTGAALNGATAVGTLVDLQVSYQVQKEIGITAYAGHLERGDALHSPATIGSLNYGFIEVNFSF